MNRLLLLSSLAVGLLAAPVYAQPKNGPLPLAVAPMPTSKQPPIIKKEDEVPDTGSAQLMGRFMEDTLPYLNGQRIRYKEEGNIIGSAVRRKLVILFEDEKGNYVGKAVRKTQQLTQYFDADNNYLGFKINQAQSAQAHTVTVRPGDKMRARPAPDDE